MKKIFIIFSSGLLTISVLSGCSGTAVTHPTCGAELQIESTFSSQRRAIESQFSTFGFNFNIKPELAIRMYTDSAERLDGTTSCSISLDVVNQDKTLVFQQIKSIGASYGNCINNALANSSELGVGCLIDEKIGTRQVTTNDVNN